MKLFRRRGKAGAKAAGSANAAGDASAQADDAKAASDTRITDAQIADASSTKGYGVLKVDHSASATVSTLANDRQETTMALSEQLIQEDVDEQRSVYSVDSGHSWDNLKHLSRREQMWYKNQMWLLEKQKKEAARASPARSFDKATGVERSYSGGSLGPLREQHKMWLLDRQGKNDARGTPSRSVEKYYGAGVAKHTDSPKGVDEFEATHANEVARKSLKEMKMRFRSKTIRRRSEKNSLLDDDTRTQQSSSMFADEETCTNQSTDDGTGTNQTSTIFDEETMGSATLDDTLGSETIEGTQNGESESLFASLQETASASMSYVFELIDDDKQRRKYKLGEGQSGSATKPRKGTAKTSSSTLEDTSNRRDTGDEAGPLKDSASYVDPTDEVCPIIPYILEEMRGWRDDTVSAVNQVMYAFFISPDDIDRVADKLRDAKVELAGMHRDKPEKRRHSARYL